MTSVQAAIHRSFDSVLRPARRGRSDLPRELQNGTAEPACFECAGCRHGARAAPGRAPGIEEPGDGRNHRESRVRRGYFREIRVLSVGGETVVRKVLAPAQGDVPEWFTRLLPLSAPGAQSLVSSGWRELGRVVVVSHPNFAYQQLWRTGLQTIAWLLLVYAVAIAAIIAFLAMLLRPLKQRLSASRSRSVNGTSGPLPPYRTRATRPGGRRHEQHVRERSRRSRKNRARPERYGARHSSIRLRCSTTGAASSASCSR